MVGAPAGYLSVAAGKSGLSPRAVPPDPSDQVTERVLPARDDLHPAAMLDRVAGAGGGRLFSGLRGAAPPLTQPILKLRSVKLLRKW